MIRQWAVATGMPVLQGRLESSAGADREIAAVAFLPEGARAVVRERRWGAPELWDAESGRKILSLRGLLGSAAPVAISPDGASLAAGVAKLTGTGKGSAVSTPSACDTATGRLSAPSRCRQMHSIASSDGTRIASGGGMAP
jgi:hypothetical protein